MSTRQLKLPDLVVKSLVTRLTAEDQKAIQGGNRDNGENAGTTSLPIFC